MKPSPAVLSFMMAARRNCRAARRNEQESANPPRLVAEQFKFKPQKESNRRKREH
jgi:hypothetical protein